MGTLQQACYSGDVPAVESFLAREPKLASCKDADQRTPLHWACAGGRLDVVRLLLARPDTSGSVNFRDDAGYNPLISAAANGNKEIVELLLASGADANVENEQGCIPLHYHKGKSHIIDVLLPVTKDLDARDVSGVTALHRAAGPGYGDATQRLLAAGANVNVTDKMGNTPLHYACEEGRADIVSMLLENGARSDIKNREGKTASQLAPSRVVRDKAGPQQ